MMIETKPGVLRSELIQLKTVLTKGVAMVRETVTEQPKRKYSLWEHIKGAPGKADKEFLDGMIVNLTAQAMTQKLDAMIAMCDEAFESGAKLYLDVEDKMYINSLHTMNKVLKG